MEKIKIKRDFEYTPPENITWGEVKKLDFIKDDWILDSFLYLTYEDEESDEEFERRKKIEKIKKGFKEKHEYELYLKLKEKYEND